MENIFASKEYKISRGAYKAQCAFDYFISLLVSDAFLSKLLTYIGLSDSATGIISSIISVTFLFQLFSLGFARKIKSIKKTVITLDTFSQFFFLCLFLLPFLKVGFNTKTLLVFVIIIIAYLFLYLNNNIAYRWGNAFVDPEKRGTYSAAKEMISLLSGIVFTLFVGYVVDGFEAKGKTETGFLFIVGCMAVVMVMNFISLMLFKDIPIPESGNQKSVKQIWQHTLGDRKMRNVIILVSLYAISSFFITGFLGTFKTVDLGYSLGQVQVINTVACLFRFAISIPYGRYSDKKGYAKGFQSALVLLLISYGFGIFATTSSRWCIVVFTIIYNMSLAGIGQNIYNLAYYYADGNYILEAMAVNNSVKGVIGFIASLAGGAVLSFIQSRNISIGFMQFGQQWLMVIAAVFGVIALVFNTKVVSKQKGIKQ